MMTGLADREAILENAAPVIHRVAGWYVRRTRAEREDLVQEGWVGVLLAIKNNEPRTPEHWNAVIQKHVWGRMFRYVKCRTLIRPPARLSMATVACVVPKTEPYPPYWDAPSREPEPYVVASQYEEQARLQSAIEALPGPSATLLRRTYGLGQEAEEHQTIAQNMGYCVNHVRTLRSRALDRLRWALAV